MRPAGRDQHWIRDILIQTRRLEHGVLIQDQAVICSCRPHGRAGFAFAGPSSCEWTDVLTEVELSGPGGSAIIDDDSNRPALILREQTSGRVRALLRGESAALIGLDASASGSVVQETDVEIFFSRGLPQLARR